MDESFGQLVVLILIGIGWVIKGIAENRKRQQQKEQARRQQQEELARGPEMTEPEREVPLPLPPIAPHPQTESASPRSRTSEIRAWRPSTTSSARPHLSEQATSYMPRTITVSERRTDTRRAMLRRLSGGARPSSLRAATRAGILWSEVLGPPRAVRGHHVPPTFVRGRKGIG